MKHLYETIFDTTANPEDFTVWPEILAIFKKYGAGSVSKFFDEDLYKRNGMVNFYAWYLKQGVFSYDLFDDISAKFKQDKPRKLDISDLKGQESELLLFRARRAGLPWCFVIKDADYVLHFWAPHYDTIQADLYEISKANFKKFTNNPLFEWVQTYYLGFEVKDALKELGME